MQHDDRAALRRKLIDRLAQASRTFELLEHEVVGRERSLGFRELARFGEGEAAEPAPVPSLVLQQREVANAVGPGGDLPSPLERRGGRAEPARPRSGPDRRTRRGPPTRVRIWRYTRREDSPLGRCCARGRRWHASAGASGRGKGGPGPTIGFVREKRRWMLAVHLGMSAFMSSGRALSEQNPGVKSFSAGVARPSRCIVPRNEACAEGLAASSAALGGFLGAGSRSAVPGTSAWAGTSDIVTRVACPALPTDVRAEFEARAQVDLTLRSAGGGDLEAICHDLTAKVTWRPRTGGSFERDVSAATPAALVDALLFAVAELAGDAARAAREPPTPPPDTGRRRRGAELATTRQPRHPTPSRPPPLPTPLAGRSRRARGGGFPAIPFGLVLGGTASLFSTSGGGRGRAQRGALVPTSSEPAVDARGGVRLRVRRARPGLGARDRDVGRGLDRVWFGARLRDRRRPALGVAVRRAPTRTLHARRPTRRCTSRARPARATAG